jgi:hypothetical protein
MSVGSPTPMAGWQRANVLAAAQYLADVVSRSPADVKAQAVYEGLLEVLEPARRAVRQQRELSQSVLSAATVREKCAGRERRGSDRRRVNLGPQLRASSGARWSDASAAVDAPEPEAVFSGHSRLDTPNRCGLRFQNRCTQCHNRTKPPGWEAPSAHDGAPRRWHGLCGSRG